MLRKFIAAAMVAALAPSAAFAVGQAYRKQGTATYHIVFYMVDSSDHVTAKTGLSPSLTCYKNAGGSVTPSGAITELGNGWYKLAGNTTDTNTLGTIACTATASGADPRPISIDVVTYDPFTYPDTGATIAGVTTATTCTTTTTATTCTNLTNAPTNGDFTSAMKTALNSATPTVTAGTVTDKTGYALTSAYDAAKTAAQAGDTMKVSSGTGAGQLDFTSGVVKSNVTQFGGSAGTFASGRPEVNVSHFGGTAGTFASGRPEVNTTHVAGTAQTAGDFLGVWTPTKAGFLTGDSFTRLGAPAGASHAADVAAVFARTDVATSTRMATFSLPTNFPALSITAGGLVDITQTAAEKGWDGLVGDHTTVNTFGAAINDTQGQVNGLPNGTEVEAAVWDADPANHANSATFGVLVGTNLDVPTSTRMATFTLPTNFPTLSINTSGQVTLSSCLFCLTATQVAAAVLDDPLSSHVTPGTAGAALATSSAPSASTIAAAVVDQTLTGHTDAGTAGKALSEISPGTVTVVSPYSPTTQKLALVRGDDYPASGTGSIPPFTSSSWPSLVGATVRMTIRRRPSVGRDPILITLLDVSASRVAGAGEQSVAFAPMSAANADPDQQSGSTDDLVPGPAAAKWDVQATLADGTVKTLVGGLVDVLEDETRIGDTP